MEDGEIDEEEDMEEGEIENKSTVKQNCELYDITKRGTLIHLGEMPVGFHFTHERAQLPRKAYEGDAGYDLTSPDEYTIQPGEKVRIDTGLQLELPPNIFGEIASRSGLAYQCEVEVVGGVGIIDSNYHGNIYVGLRNKSEKFPYTVKIGSRIAQIIFQPCYSVAWARVYNIYNNLTPSERGEKAYGSSGSF